MNLIPMFPIICATPAATARGLGTGPDISIRTRTATIGWRSSISPARSRARVFYEPSGQGV